MVSIGQGAKVMVEKQLESLGTNVLIIIPISTTHTATRGTTGTITLTAEDAFAIEKECSAVRLCFTWRQDNHPGCFWQPELDNFCVRRRGLTMILYGTGQWNPEDLLVNRI